MSSTWVPPGFLTGTTILTQAGYRAIEALRPSDKVITADGKVVHIDRIEMVQSKAPPIKFLEVFSKQRTIFMYLLVSVSHIMMVRYTRYVNWACQHAKIHQRMLHTIM